MPPLPVFLNRAPRSPLDELIETLWYCQGYVPGHALERRLPSGVVELIINLRDDQFRFYDQFESDTVRQVNGSVLCGPQTRPTVLDTMCQESAMGVQFKPGGAVPFFDVLIRDMENSHRSLTDVWGTEAELLRERLLESSRPQTRLLLLEEALLERVIRSNSRHPAVVFALSEFQSGRCGNTIAQVVRKTGFSQRRFIQVFHDEVGMTPKLFCRLLRFQNALRQTDGKSKPDWTSIALLCGYFDQSHLIRDFREFAGISPTAYVSQRGEHRNHVPIGD